MKSFLTASMVGSLCVLLAAGLATTAFAADNNMPVAGEAVPAATSTPKATKGSVKCTAAINSDGSVLSCKHCDVTDTYQIDTGSYQVGFKKPCQNILAVRGWSRWVQPDTLATSSTDAYCTTADRSGDANAIYVQCQNASGPADTSFFLFVAK